MKRVMVIVVALALLSGCSTFGLNSGAKITVRDSAVKSVKLTDTLEELQEIYGEPIVHYRAYKQGDVAHRIKDLYFTADDYTQVIATVVDDEIIEVITVKTNQ